jgi:cobalt-zinc-cadmium efflux system outer membrane protein
VYTYKLLARTLVCVSAAVLAEAAPPGTLNELLEVAARENRELLAVRERLEEAKGALRQAGVRPAPALEVNGASGNPLGSPGENQFSVGVAQMLETAGKRSRRLEVARQQLALAEAEYGERTRQLRFELSSRYADFVSESERLRALERLIEINRRSLELTRARVEKGDAAALDASLIAVEISRVEALRASTLGRQGAARIDLARLAGVAEADLGTLAWFAMPELDRFHEEDLSARALRARPDLQAMRYIEKRAGAETQLTLAEGRPNITVSAGYSRIYSRFDFYGLDDAGARVPLKDRDDILALGVSIPLSGQGRNRGNVEASAARARAARLRREYLERSIPLEVASAWRRWRNSIGALRALSGAAIEQAEKNVEVIRGAYQLGNLRLLDVLNEQRRLLDMQLAAVDVRADALRGFFELERAVGEDLP